MYLVATHSGYFTRSQFLRYTQQTKGCLVHRFTTKTLTQGHATAKEYGYQTLVFHVFSRQIYGAIDKDNLRNRRQLSKELIRTRLLILDFVLSDPNRQYLETEADKVRYFNRELGIPLTLIPCRTYKSRKSGSQTDRYFVDRFPIFLTSEPVPTPTFVYCDSDLPGLFGYLTHVRNYEATSPAGFMGSISFTPLPTLQSFAVRSAFSRGPLILAPAWMPPNWPGISTSADSGRATTPSP